jgi:TPP-dependent pyruvate/acetoin dehydrogenase alpha subunit
MLNMSLGDLAKPTEYQAPIEINGRDMELLREHLRTMIMIRLVEQHLATMRRDGHIGGPVHLGVGQEAVAVGVSQSLRASDRVFGAHRSHSHVLALGSSYQALFAEILGKETGLSKGMGGSMHLWDGPRGFFGSVPIVGGTVALAVGAALAAKLQGIDAVGVSYLGDGACEEGVVHESLNLARVLDAPTLFVVENNLFSSHMHISLRQPGDSTARFAAAHGIPFEVVDGNDVLAVADAASRLIEGARAGHGPGFLEAVTYRWLGHVDWRDDVDVGVARSKADLTEWHRRDPIARLRIALESAGSWSPDEDAAFRSELSSAIEAAWAEAVSDPWPSGGALLDRVYSGDGGA